MFIIKVGNRNTVFNRNLLCRRLNFARDAKFATGTPVTTANPGAAVPLTDKVPKPESATVTPPIPVKVIPEVKPGTSTSNVIPPSSTINIVPDITYDPLIKKERTVEKTVSFEDVPGPTILKQISKLWTVIPVVGTQVTASAVQYLLSAGKLFGSQFTWGSNPWIVKRLLDEYGPVVRLQGPFGGDVVILSRPEDASELFQTEGPYPIRSCLDSVEKYRLKYRRFKQAGPFLMYGPEWEKLRKNIEKPLQSSIVQRFDKIDKSCDELINRIVTIRNRQEEVPPNFDKEINKWCMSCLFGVVLNNRLGFMNPLGITTTSDAGKLLDALNGATDSIRKCEYGLHLWKFFETPAWKSLVKNCDAIDSVLNKYLHQAQDTLRNRKIDPKSVAEQPVSLIETLLLKDGVLMEDVLTLLLDMMLIGVNATTHTVAFLLYHIARNPRCQYKLYEEIVSKPYFTKDTIKTMPYLEACIKESLRLKPPIPILSRVLNKDVIVHNYSIPKGTYVLLATHLSSLKEENFEDALKFKPERWLSSEMHMAINPEMQTFASIPFGHGPKACLAKDLAEMQVSLLISKILKAFRVEYHYGEIESNNKLLASPTKPLKFRFVSRSQ